MSSTTGMAHNLESVLVLQPLLRKRYQLLQMKQSQIRLHGVRYQPHIRIADLKQAKPELVTPMRPVFDKFKPIEQRRNRYLLGCHIGHVTAKRHKAAAHVKRIRHARQHDTDRDITLQPVFATQGDGGCVIHHPITRLHLVAPA